MVVCVFIRMVSMLMVKEGMLMSVTTTMIIESVIIIVVSIFMIVVTILITMCVLTHAFGTITMLEMS